MEIASVKEFVESWKLDQTCSVVSNPIMNENNPCYGHEIRHSWAVAECAIINTPSDDNPFKPCIEKLSPTDIARSHIECLYDACNCDRGGDCECLCSSLAAFGEMCTQVGSPIRWRTNHRCPIQCEGGKQYLSCGSVCQKTCKDLANGFNQTEAADCPEPCVEGCFCPDGFFQNADGICVVQEECECWLDGHMYHNGMTVNKGCEVCDCIGGVFNCFTKLDCLPVCNNATEFLCVESQKCIPIGYVCDDVFDCPDHSDEFNCTCGYTSFHCGNGQCIDPALRCDGLPNCRDASDEVDCEKCQEFECATNSKCIPCMLSFKNSYTIYLIQYKIR